MKLTKDQIREIKSEAKVLSKVLVNMHGGDTVYERRKELANIHLKNKEANMNLEDSCFFGPYSAAEVFEGTGLEGELKDGFNKLVYIMALENVVGTSTRMVYDKSKNVVSANTPSHDKELVYDPKDVELGLWDKICAFLGITTEHSKKVAFAKESIKAQKDKLDNFNKSVVKQKKDNFVEKHKEFAEHNESVVREAENTENGFKALFFGEEAVEDYQFKNGEKLMAVAACIAMYHQESGKDIANMSLEEINSPENAELRNRLKEIGKEYREEFISEKAKTIDNKITHLDDFLITSDKFSTRDKHLLSRIATDRAFDINWDKVEAGKDITDKKQQKEMACAKALVMLKVKAQLRKVVGKEFPNGQKNGFGEITSKDMEHLNAFKAAREYHMFMEEMSAERYDKAAEHLQGLEGFDVKPENYNEFLEKADSIVSQKEVKALTKENKEIKEPEIEDEGMSIH